MTEQIVTAKPAHKEVVRHGDVTETTTSAENINIPTKQGKSPEQQFVEWLQANNFVSYAVVAAPKGGAVTVENYTPEGWRVVIVVAEAQQKNGV